MQKKKGGGKKRAQKDPRGCLSWGRMMGGFYLLMDSFLYVQTFYNKHELIFIIRIETVTKIS